MRKRAVVCVVVLAVLLVAGGVVGAGTKDLQTGVAPSRRAFHARPAPASARDGVGPTEHRGGPDRFGYVFRDSLAPDGPDFDWVELEGDPEATLHSVALWSSTPNLPLDFTWEFYGVPRDHAMLSSYGAFSAGSGIWAGEECDRWPGASTEDDLVAVLWDRLRPCVNFPTRTSIYTRAYAAGECPYAGYPGACFVGEFPDLCRSLGGPPYIEMGRWEIVVLDDDSMVLQYLDVGEDPGDSYAVGIQSPDEPYDPDNDPSGLLYGCHEEDIIVPPLAIRFWAPDVVAGADDETLEGCAGSTVRYQMRAKNATGQSDTLAVQVLDSDAPASAPTVLGSVPDGEWERFEVAVELPMDAAVGASVTTVVEVASGTDPSVSWTPELTTTVASPAVSRAANSPSAHMDSCAVYHDGGIYVYGGAYIEGDMDRFDVATGRWTALTPDPEPLEYPMDAAYGRDAAGREVIVLIPDLHGTPWFHVYVLEEDSWEHWPVPAGFPAEGLWGADIACDPEANVCYITGGATEPGAGDLATAYAYAVGDHAVEPLPPMTTARAFHASFVWNGMLCVAGGINRSGKLSSTQCLDLGTQAWGPESTALGELPASYWAGGDGVIWFEDRWAPVIGGGADEASSTVPYLAFDGTEWVELGYPEEATYRLEGVGVGNVFYLMHGAWERFLSTPLAQTVEVCGSQTADLWVTKELSTVGPVAPGDAVEYVIRAGNEGPQRAVGVSVTDALDPGLEYVHDSCGGSWDAGSRTWTWMPGSLPAGSRVQCRLTTSVVSDAGHVIRNAVTITGDGVDPQPGDETSEVLLTVHRQGIPGLTPTGVVVLVVAVAMAAGVLLRRR